MIYTTAFPFRLYEGNRLNDMVESIRENGIIVPIIVRPTKAKKVSLKY
jgi:ParB family chromosome partitioning protein